MSAIRVRRIALGAFEADALATLVLLKQQKQRQREEISELTVDAEALKEQADQWAARLAISTDFRRFLVHWRFVDRETGTVRSFAELWPGQVEFAETMQQEPWVFALKAGKLGFTELECAWDAFVALFRQPNARVGIFSKDLSSAKQLLAYVKFGLTRLPDWLGLPFADGPGSETTVSLALRAGPDDVRWITSYAAKPTTAVDQSLTHAHIDELSNVIDPEGVWGSVSTIVPDPPSGTLHVVTRGRGMRAYTAKLWASCYNKGGEGKLYGFFSPWTGRPRPEGWHAQQTATMTRQAARWYAPESEADALAGDDSSQFIEAAQWDMCEDEALVAAKHEQGTFAVNLMPGDRIPVVIGLDAGVNRDYFAAVMVSRHPDRKDDVAVRAVRIWRPQDQLDHHVDLEAVEKWIVGICRGFCAFGHAWWKGWKQAGCASCAAAKPVTPGYRVVQIAYDPYQLAEMGQRLNRHKVAWAEEFPQQAPRLQADSALRSLIISRRLAHMGDQILRAAALGAAAEIVRREQEESKLRIVKGAPDAKIDALVALSMASSRILYLNVGNGAG